jgi:hypothetical protein
MNYKFYHVCCLPEALQIKVRKAVKRSLSASGLVGEELNEAIQTAMNSKVYDLEDTINIERVLRSVK